MRRFGFFPGNIFVCALFVFVLGGCISAGSSPSSRFYMLKHPDGTAPVKKFNIPAGLITSIGPVNIPQYLDRPQIVTQNDKGLIDISQFERWGESLDLAIAQAVNEDLNLMLPGGTFEMFPCNFSIPLDYQVIVDVLRLEANLKKDLLMVAQWSIIDAKAKKMLFTSRSELSEKIEPHDYFGLADALSRSVYSLSVQIAGDLSELANRPKPDDQDEED
jgi:uncharacterized lipoprotein YmbA